MKRLVLAALFSALPFVPTAAQTQIKIRFAFEGEARASSTNASEVGNVLALRTALRAWTDSVDILLDQAFMSAGERGWIRAQGDERADYVVRVIGLPVLNEERQPTGMTIYSLAVFEPGFSDWKYTSQRVGYALGADQGAQAIMTGAQGAINDRRRLGSR